MNAYKAEAVLTEDGKLTLVGLPFAAGKMVEVIIVEQGVSEADRALRDEDEAYLVGVSGLMTEWESAEDELAYGDL